MANLDLFPPLADERPFFGPSLPAGIQFKRDMKNPYVIYTYATQRYPNLGSAWKVIGSPIKHHHGSFTMYGEGGIPFRLVHRKIDGIYERGCEVLRQYIDESGTSVKTLVGEHMKRLQSHVGPGPGNGKSLMISILDDQRAMEAGMSPSADLRDIEVHGSIKACKDWSPDEPNPLARLIGSLGDSDNPLDNIKPEDREIWQDIFDASDKEALKRTRSHSTSSQFSLD